MSLPSLAPVVIVLFLAELAVGTALVAVAADFSGDVDRGFPGTTVLICCVLGLVDVGFIAVLPTPPLLTAWHISVASYNDWIHHFVGTVIAMLLYAIFCGVGTTMARRFFGVVVAILGCIVVGGSVIFAPPSMGLASLLLFIPSTVFAGSVFGGMLLGHWYLIAPNLSFRPLRQVVILIFVAVGLNAIAAVVSIASADSSARTALLSNGNAALFGLLVVGSGIVAAAVVSSLTYYFARTRANQPATAMLYALIIIMFMGIIPAHLLYFSTSVPV